MADPVNPKIADLHACKVEKVIETLHPSSPEEFGSHAGTKKLNAICIIQDAVKKYPDRFVPLLLQHNKLTVLVHDVVLIPFWRDEILPQLLAANKKRPKNEQGEEPPFCGTTAISVLGLGKFGDQLLRQVISRPEVLQSLNAGTDVLDVIEHSVKSLQFFLANNPEEEPKQGPIEPVDRSNPQLKYSVRCEMAVRSAKILRELVENVKLLSSDTVRKLLHPDTGLISTLIDLLWTKPYRFYYITTDIGNNWVKHQRPDFHEIEFVIWDTIQALLVENAQPNTNPLAIQPFDERLENIWRLKQLLASERLLETVPGTRKVKIFLCLNANDLCHATNPPTLPPPEAPYHEAIRLEVEQKKDTIVQMYVAMGTFEHSLDYHKKYLPMLNAISGIVRDINHWCFKCGKTDAKFQCKGCHYAWYCDRECQIADRKKHKRLCHPANVPKEVRTRFAPVSRCPCPDCENDRRRMEQAKAKANGTLNASGSSKIKESKPKSSTGDQ